jgi:hypothetical protein
MRRFLLPAALATLLVVPASASAAKYKQATAQIAANGDLQVHVEQQGLGTRVVTYTLSAEGDLWYACDGAPWASVSWGGIGWSDPVTATASSGRTVADLVFRRAEGSYSTCSGQLTRPWTRYDQIRVKDSAGSSIALQPIEIGVPF